MNMNFKNNINLYFILFSLLLLLFGCSSYENQENIEGRVLKFTEKLSKNPNDFDKIIHEEKIIIMDTLFNIYNRDSRIKMTHVKLLEIHEKYNFQFDHFLVEKIRNKNIVRYAVIYKRKKSFFAEVIDDIFDTDEDKIGYNFYVYNVNKIYFMGIGTNPDFPLNKLK